jgi:hypothetical protein
MTSLVSLQVQRGLGESGEQKSESVIVPPLEEFLWRQGQEQWNSREKLVVHRNLDEIAPLLNLLD